MKPKNRWWLNFNEVEAFARILNEAGKFRDKDAVIYFFQKPWKKDKLHKLWKEMGEPTVDDREKWNEFLDSFGRVEEKLKEVT